jgi:hypothetical protein
MNEILKEIALRFRGMEVEADNSVSEDVADILIKVGYLVRLKNESDGIVWFTYETTF